MSLGPLAVVAALEVRRVALPLGAPLVAVVAALLAASGSDATEVARVIEDARGTASMGYDAARAAWLGATFVILALAVIRAARIGAEWRGRDALWLGPLPVARIATATAALVGVAAGATLLALVAAGAIAAVAPRPDAPLERLFSAGPRTSIRLDAGARLNHAFAKGLPAPPAGAVLRIRAAPAVGGRSPVTEVTAVAGGEPVRASVARHTRVEVPLAAGAAGFELVNEGAGAAALIGPAPFEAWVPSSAFLAGHLRVALRVAWASAALAALALAAGAWMRSGIAAGLALALGWIAARGGPDGAAGHGFTEAVGALAVGDVPRALGALGVLANVALGAAGAGLAAVAFARVGTTGGGE